MELSAGAWAGIVIACILVFAVIVYRQYLAHVFLRFLLRREEDKYMREK
jgi:hypothetical protein